VAARSCYVARRSVAQGMSFGLSWLGSRSAMPTSPPRASAQGFVSWLVLYRRLLFRHARTCSGFRTQQRNLYKRFGMRSWLQSTRAARWASRQVDSQHGSVTNLVLIVLYHSTGARVESIHEPPRLGKSDELCRLGCHTFEPGASPRLGGVGSGMVWLTETVPGITPLKS